MFLVAEMRKCDIFLSWGNEFWEFNVFKTLKNRGLLILSAAILLTGVCSAQSEDSRSISLNHSKGLKHSAPLVRNEFRLSLGSQMFSESTSTFTQPQSDSRFSEAISFSGYQNNQTGTFADRAGLRIRSSRNVQKKLSPVITLNNSYESNAIGFNDSASSGLSIAGTNGRLQIYGEYEQKHTPQITVPQINSGAGVLRGSAVTAVPGTPDQPESQEKAAALASRYYLEAIYSFKPTLKGKVSFKRSMIDTFESEEKLQVEGIVDATSNVQIKAGFDNEIRPEVTEPKSNKDTKVWTEFILKF